MNRQQLFFLLVFFGMSVGSWVIGKLREQAKIRHSRDQARREFEERLRTGQVAPGPNASPAPAPSPQAQDLAERRQAQLRELRRQQEEGRGRGSTVLVGRPTGPTMPQRTVVVGRGGQGPGVTLPGGVRTGPTTTQIPGRRPQAPVPAAPPTVDPRLEHQRRRAAEQAERDRARREAAAAEEAAIREETLRRTVTARPQEEIAAGLSAPINVRSLLIGPAGRGRPREELRRLIAVSEVLAKPVSLRD